MATPKRSQTGTTKKTAKAAKSSKVGAATKATKSSSKATGAKSAPAAKASKSTKSASGSKTQTPRSHGNPWTSADLKQLRQLARERTLIRVAAVQLGRSLDSVKSKASEEQISFKATKRAGAAKKRS